MLWFHWQTNIIDDNTLVKRSVFSGCGSLRRILLTHPAVEVASDIPVEHNTVADAESTMTLARVDHHGVKG